MAADVDLPTGTPQRDHTGARPRSATSLDKAIQILSCFETARYRLRVTDVAQRVGVDKGTASRLLAQLSEAGILERNPDGYALGWRVGALGAIRTTTLDPSGSIFAAVSELVAQVHSTVQFVVYNLEIHRGVVTCAAESTRRVRVAASLGSVLPLHATAAGRAILTVLCDSDRSAALGACDWARYTPATLTDPLQVLDAVERARASGYAVVRGEYFPEQCSLAAPVTAPSIGLYGALTVLVVPGELGSAATRARLGQTIASAAGGLACALSAGTPADLYRAR